MPHPLHDFDAAWADDTDDPVVVRLLGRDWTCKRPSEVPAALLLRLDRLLIEVSRLARTGTVSPDTVVDDDLSTEGILRQLAGDENVDAWLNGVDVDGVTRCLPYTRLQDVSRYLFSVYRGQDPGEAGAAPANREERRAAKKKKGSRSSSSSSTGRQSKRTSPASTTSTT